MTDHAQQRRAIIRALSADGLYVLWRAVWWTGLALMLLINLYTSPLSEWIERDKTVAAARLGLLTRSYANTSPDSEPLRPFAATADALRLDGWTAAVQAGRVRHRHLDRFFRA